MADPPPFQSYVDAWTLRHAQQLAHRDPVFWASVVQQAKQEDRPVWTVLLERLPTRHDPHTS